MSKKATFMKMFKECESKNYPQEFLLEALDIALTEERANSLDFNKKMFDLTEKWLKLIEEK